MRTWFASPGGTITISAIALLSFVGYTLMEMRYYLAQWIPGDGAAAVEALAIVLIVAGWVAALSAARDGKRGGFRALLALAVFSILIGVYDLQYALAPDMHWPERLAVFVVLVAGVISTIGVASYLRSGRTTA